MIVPVGTQVTLRRVMLCGNKVVDTGSDDEEEDDDYNLNESNATATVSVTVITLCGDVWITKNDE